LRESNSSKGITASRAFLSRARFLAPLGKWEMGKWEMGSVGNGVSGKWGQWEMGSGEMGSGRNEKWGQEMRNGVRVRK